MCYPLCQVAAPLWERELCAWTARDHQCLPFRCPAPAARCYLPGARGPGPPLSRLRPSLHVFSLGASAPLSVPLPPPPRLRLPPLRASSPAGRTGSEARCCAGCRAGGRRAWAEPGAGIGGGGWEPRTEPQKGCCIPPGWKTNWGRVGAGSLSHSSLGTPLSIFLLLTINLDFKNFINACVYVYSVADVHRGQRHWIPLEPNTQAAVSCLIQVLRTQLWPSAREVHVLTCHPLVGLF